MAIRRSSIITTTSVFVVVLLFFLFFVPFSLRPLSHSHSPNHQPSQYDGYQERLCKTKNFKKDPIWPLPPRYVPFYFRS
jgi:hypothetical protein